MSKYKIYDISLVSKMIQRSLNETFSNNEDVSKPTGNCEIDGQANITLTLDDGYTYRIAVYKSYNRKD